MTSVCLSVSVCLCVVAVAFQLVSLCSSSQFVHVCVCNDMPSNWYLTCSGNLMQHLSPLCPYVLLMLFAPTMVITSLLTHPHPHSYTLSCAGTHSLIHSLTHSLTHLLTFSLTHLLLCPRSLTHTLTHPPTHPLTHPPTLPLTHFITRRLVHSPIRPFPHPAPAHPSHMCRVMR